MVKTVSRFISYIFAVMTLMTSGCSVFNPKEIKKPKIKLEQIDVQNPSLTGATVIFMVNVFNPNPFALQVDGLKYDLEVGGRDLTQGDIKGKTKVDAQASTVVHVPVPMNYADVFTSIKQLVGGGRTPYRLKGSAKVGFLSIPFDESGQLKFENGKISKEKAH